MTSMPLIGQLIVQAFHIGRGLYPETAEQWIKASYRAGGQIPNSSAFRTFQQIGELDVLCRALEDEIARIPSADGQIDFRFHYLMLFSELWVGAAYAISFALTDRGLFQTNDAFKSLAEDLRVVRVQLEKHQIASDRKLDKPLDLVTGPGQLGEVRSFQYDNKDPLRAHIGRTGLSDKSSAMWELIDLKANVMRWVERRNLADRMLQIFAAD